MGLIPGEVSLTWKEAACYKWTLAGLLAPLAPRRRASSATATKEGRSRSEPLGGTPPGQNEESL